MVNCPHCGFKGDEKAFKLLRDPWMYNYYTVKPLECPNCKKNFRHYVSVIPGRRVAEYYIPKAKIEDVGTKREEKTISKHTKAVNMLREIGDLLGFYVTIEETTADKVYKYDCIWRDAPEHGPLKVFEVEFKSDVDKALTRLTHAYDLWHPELYLIVADERDYERAERLVKPLVKGAFAKIRDKLKILSVEDVVNLHRGIYENRRVREVIQQFSKRS